jgi:uncharacterized protein with GYD domain
MKDFYMVTGQCEMIAVVERPPMTSPQQAILGSTPQGNITSATCRAFTEEEYRQVISD